MIVTGQRSQLLDISISNPKSVALLTRPRPAHKYNYRIKTNNYKNIFIYVNKCPALMEHTLRG